MSDQSQWIAAGWQTFQDEVLKKGWPDSPALRLLIEVAFFGGANWLIHILEDEGTTPDVLGRLTIELTKHQQHAERLSRELDESKQ